MAESEENSEETDENVSNTDTESTEKERLLADTISKKYTTGQKISNFLYHNKWWLIIAVPIFFIAAFLIFQYITKTEPDITLLILIPNSKVEEIAPEICEYFEQFTPDLNGDGKVIVGYMYLPTGGESNTVSVYSDIANSQNLTVQLSTTENLIIIADKKAESTIVPKSILYNLSLDYLDTPFIQDDRILIGETDLRTKINYQYYFTHDAYIGIRYANNSNFKQQYNIVKDVIANLNSKQ
ncbi:MAG: hypothetical protein LBM93_02965 [Oscillospiraceae bacterium]|jgi:hypothetical protein|nr:hypothetical protein [Oscillospiraceae bacterium]